MADGKDLVGGQAVEGTQCDELVQLRAAEREVVTRLGQLLVDPRGVVAERTALVADRSAPGVPARRVGIRKAVRCRHRR